MQNVNEAPSGAVISSNEVDENAPDGSLVGIVSGADPDAGSVLTYSFVAGGDADGRFTIDPNTGELRVVYGPWIDFEASSQQLVTVRITDEQGLSIDQSIVINVRNTNDAPVIVSDGGSSAYLSIPENQTAVTMVVAFDDDVGDVLTYSIIGGVDAALFAIDSVTGELRFTSPMQFINPLDADLDNVYEVIVECRTATAAPRSRRSSSRSTTAATLPRASC